MLSTPVARSLSNLRPCSLLQVSLDPVLRAAGQEPPPAPPPTPPAVRTVYQPAAEVQTFA